jgi:prephenate dehydrogenase
MKIDTLSVIGVGLLGGSLALAARQRRLASRVVGHDRQPGILQRAVERGLLDEARADLRAAVADADVVVFCTPVDLIAAQVVSAAPCCRPGALLTDVGSTKAGVVRAVESGLPAGVRFVGSHPLAGSEKAGPEYSRTDLFDGRLVVVTPTPATAPEALAGVLEFWRALGSRVECLSPEEHDRALALTSHLPHLVAAALAGVLPPEWEGLTATGFRDATRLASGALELWAPIFRSNRAAVLGALDRLEGQLRRFRQALAEDDVETLGCLLREGKQVRDALPAR